MLETVERISDIVDVWLSAQPNAGKPRDIEGRNLYLCSPEYMASYARRFIASGVRLVGGCCGTTPEHIRQIALAAKSMAPGLARAAGVEAKSSVASQPNARPATGARREIDAREEAGERPVHSRHRTVAAARTCAGGRARRRGAAGQDAAWTS
jgi:homocysteine S-methyltransferase